MRHHLVDGSVCPCGSTHAWERARVGICKCTSERCTRVHLDAPRKPEYPMGAPESVRQTITGLR